MTMRMKSKYYFGKTKETFYDDVVLPGCVKYEERKALLAKYGTERPPAYYEERDTLYNSIKASGHPPTIITMKLRHGDLVVMHGSHMQKYYEVSQRTSIYFPIPS